jgi:hypothetical protein
VLTIGCARVEVEGACNVLKIGCTRVEERERLGKAEEHARERDDHARRVEVEGSMQCSKNRMHKSGREGAARKGRGTFVRKG